jgi:hypothetical protein
VCANYEIYRYLHNTQQTQETNIHASSGIRTCDPSNQAASDIRLRLHGNRDQEKLFYFILFIQFLAFLYNMFQCYIVYVPCNVFRVIGLLLNEI